VAARHLAAAWAGRGVRAVGLSTHERRVRGRIGESLAGSDPRLAAMLSTFDRLADGEAMPGRERVHAGRRPAGQEFRAVMSPAPGRCWRQMAARRWIVLTWLVMSLGLIALALALAASHAGSSTPCAAWLVPACGNHVPAHRQSSPAHGHQG
jgi:hypothetical protein